MSDAPLPVFAERRRALPSCAARWLIGGTATLSSEPVAPPLATRKSPIFIAK